MRLWVVAGFQAVLVQRFCQGVHLCAGCRYLRGTQLFEQVGRYDSRQQSDDDDDDQKFQERETAGCRVMRRHRSGGFSGHGRKMNSQSP
ncbi:hypothetical protein D9M69_691450 [compost metagenome]